MAQESSRWASAPGCAGTRATIRSCGAAGGNGSGGGSEGGDQGLRRGGRERGVRGDDRQVRIRRFERSGGILRDAANGIHVGGVKFELRVLKRRGPGVGEPYEPGRQRRCASGRGG